MLAGKHESWSNACMFHLDLLKKIPRCVSAVMGMVAIALAGCATVPRAPEFTLEKKEPWKFGKAAGVMMETDHYRIYSTHTDEFFNDLLPSFVESAHQLYRTLVPYEYSRPRKLDTYMFGTRRQWYTFAKAKYPHRERIFSRISSGAFTEGSVSVNYFIRNSETLSILAHEGFHQYVGNMQFPRIPAWLNEGLACYCESIKFKGRRPIFTMRENLLRANFLRSALATDTLIPLKQMLDTNAGKEIVKQQIANTQAYYAQAWALVTFLKHSRKYAHSFDGLLKDIGSERLRQRVREYRRQVPQGHKLTFGEALFCSYITEDLETFEQEYRKYMAKLVSF